MSNNFVTFAIEDDPASHLVKRLLRKRETAIHARLTKPKLEDGAACTGYSQGSIERGSESADPADLPDRREGVVLTHVAVDVQTEAFFPTHREALVRASGRSRSRYVGDGFVSDIGPWLAKGAAFHLNHPVPWLGPATRRAEIAMPEEIIRVPSANKCAREGRALRSTD